MEIEIVQAQSVDFQIEGCNEMEDGGYGLLVRNSGLWVMYPVPDKEHYIEDISRFESITLDVQDFCYLHPTDEVKSH